MPRLPLALACALTCLASPRAHAGFVDQQSLTSDTVLYGTSVGQLFITSAIRTGVLPNGTIQDGNFFLSTAPAFATAFRVDLYVGTVATNGNRLATTTGVTVMGTNDLYFNFGSPVLIGVGGSVSGLLVVTSLDGSVFGLQADDRNPVGGTAFVGISNGNVTSVPAVDLRFNEGLGVGPFAVPEPSSLLLLGLSGAGLGLRARRRPAA